MGDGSCKAFDRFLSSLVGHIIGVGSFCAIAFQFEVVKDVISSDLELFLVGTLMVEEVFSSHIQPVHERDKFLLEDKTDCAYDDFLCLIFCVC